MKPRYRCNHGYFDRICTEGKAYWLGFLAADGCIRQGNELYVGLSSRDHAHLVRLKHCLRSQHPVRTVKRPGRMVSIFSVRSERLTHGLKQYGVVPRKTNRLTLPSLPPWLMRHYLRGYIDGDGGFYWSPTAFPSGVHSFSVTGFEPFIFRVQTVLMEACDLRRTALQRRRSGGPSATLRYSGQPQVIRIADYLYRKPCRFYLERKKPTFIP